MGMFDDVLNKVGESYGGKGFEYGTHEVIIGEVEAKQRDTKNTKDCAAIEVVVFDEKDNDKTATATLWFHTEGAAKMSVTKVLGLLVHKVGEEKKEIVRETGKKLFGSITDFTQARDVAAKLMGEKLVGQKGFAVAEPNGNYTTTSYVDLWHYPATPQSDEPAADDPLAGAEDVTEEVDIPDEL